MRVRFQPFDPAFLQDPYTTYAELREHSPVHRVRISPLALFGLVRRVARMRRAAGEPGLLRTAWQMRQTRRAGAPNDASDASATRPGSSRGPLRRRFYALSRHTDVSYVLRHPEIFSSRAMGGDVGRPAGAEPAPTDGSLIGLDPPEHTGHRAIVNRGFTPRRIAELEPRIRKLADELAAGFELRGQCDLVSAFTNPLPVGVIAELLGLDAARRDDFQRWSNALIIGSTQAGAGPNLELFREFRSYMSSVAEERRCEPGKDLISLLVHAQEEEGTLDPGQVVGFASLLLAAGSETTTNLMGNALLALQANPEQAARVRDDPSRIPDLLEETLRFDSPVQLLMRVTECETELAGVSLPEGAMVFVLLGAANRDERVFENPNRFDLDRPTQGHLAFGLGNHFCLGASLARLEAQIGLETILTRYPDWRITAPGRVERHGSFLVRGPVELPLAFTPPGR